MKTRCRRAAAMLFVGAAIFASTCVASADEEDPKARADALFQEGERLFTAGEIASACKAFAESQRLDPALGTLINLGLCHERQGKTATAFAELEEALAQARAKEHAERIRLLTEELARLEGRLSRLVLVAPAGAPPQLTMDGVALGPAALGAPFAVDPGTHTLVVSAPQKRTATLTISVAEGPATKTVNIPALEPDAMVVAPLPPSEEQGSGRRLVALSMVGVAVVSVGVGTVFGIVAKSEQDTAEELCTPGQRACASAEGVAANDSAHSAATVSTIAFGVGLVAGVVGTYLWLTSPKAPAPAPRSSKSLIVRPGGLGLVGAW